MKISNDVQNKICVFIAFSLIIGGIGFTIYASVDSKIKTNAVLTDDVDILQDQINELRKFLNFNSSMTI